MPHDLALSDLEPLDILLVEDDQQLRDSLREVLEEEGYRVQAVPSGSDAIALSARHCFDLIVTDIKTPGTDGLSALAAVKEGNPEVAGIVITGYSTEEFALRAAKLKVENYLKKPFDIEDFLRTVDGLAEKKRLAQRRMARDLVVQRALRWLSFQLVGRTAQRPFEEVEGFFEQALAPAGRDPREQAAVEALAGLRVMIEQGLPWPEELQAAFPPSLAHALLQGDELERQLALCARAFLAGDGPPAGVEDESESLEGSLLNVALSLESAQRLEEARAAFLDVLASSAGLADRYLALFGLARLARHVRHFEELESRANQAVLEGMKLGPLTHSHALTERGILLALARSRHAEEALGEALEFARSLKDSDSFALLSLAREHFLGQPAARRGRLLAYLMQPERFALASEASGWLLALLLAQPAPDIDEKRFLSKLSRACPASFERALVATGDAAVLERALPYLDGLSEERRQRVLAHAASLEDPGLAGAVALWARGKRRQEQERTVLRVFSFSGIRLYLADEALDMKRKKPLLLLLYLLYRDVPVGEEKLLDLFWPGEEAKGRASLRTTLSILRKLICPDGEGDPLVRQAGGLCLSSEFPVWFDYREFEGLVAQGRRLEASSPERAAEAFRAAVRLYRGPFLENVYEDWALEVREHAEQAYESCLRSLTESSLASQNWAQGYEYAARGLRRDPLSQPFCEMAMQALLGLQRPHDALLAFEQCRAVLAAELDVEPTTDMLRLREMAKLAM